MLGADLTRAKHILSDEHGIWLSKEDKLYAFKAFEPFAKISLANCEHSIQNKRGYIINRWKQKGKRNLEVYQVETTLHVDTAVVIRLDVDPNSEKRIEKKHISVNFSYRTYIINKGNKPRLIFTIAVKGDYLHYLIGNRNIIPLYESIPVGLETPDEKEILKVISYNK